MAGKNDVYQECSICGKKFPMKDLVPGATIRDAVAAEILLEHPGWTAESNICRRDLNAFRSRYVHSLLESEKGEMTSLEQEVLQSLKEHEFLAKNVEAEFEERWSLGKNSPIPLQSSEAAGPSCCASRDSSPSGSA